MLNSSYEVFISFKYLDESGNPTVDSELARQVYEHLTDRGLTVFLSTVSLEQSGIAAYKAAIDDALDSAKVLISVGTKSEHLNSKWVKYEWDSFFNDIISGVKPDGRVFVYADGIRLIDLPRALRQMQCVPHGAESLDRLYRFVRNSLGEPKATSPSETASGSEPKSVADACVARLDNGRTVAHSEDAPAGFGGMKSVFYSRDRQHVLAFFNKPLPEYQRRLEMLLKRYNPTLLRDLGGAAGSERSAKYFRARYCWPLATIVEPSLGVYLPAFPDQFLFETGMFAGQPKEARWFVSKRLTERLPVEAQGDLRDRLRVCVVLARLVRRLNQAGLAHADLSSKNVLVDMCRGEAILLDLDALVVPGLLPPSVLGTMGYVAPDQLLTWHLPLGHPQRRLPDIHSDEHALAVLIYELLLQRHPLRGRKVHSTESAEEDEHLSMGEFALFVEHPTDRSNSRPDLSFPYTHLGQPIAKLFERAFVNGLHHADARPSALEWERTLVESLDLLYPCLNSDCSQRWILHSKGGVNSTVECPFCGMPLEEVRWLEIVSQSGKLLKQIPLYDGLEIYHWHVEPVFPGEEADHRRWARIVKHDHDWHLSLDRVDAMLETTPVATHGETVAFREGAELTVIGAQFQGTLRISPRSEGSGK